MDVPRPTDDDPLAQPTRARAFAFVAKLRRPAAIEEIAAHLGLHATGVRTHLARLEQAGLLERRTVRLARGRPRHEWLVAARAAPGGAPPTAYHDLALWLAGAVHAGASSERELARHGVEIGRRLAPDGTAEQPADLLHDAFAAMGFQPEQHRLGDATTYALCNCPYRDAVHAGRLRICALHEGITRGLLERVAPAGKLSAFIPRDPDRAGCVVQVAIPAERS
jgi:predicted ArsR family transcriptional regulator